MNSYEADWSGEYPCLCSGEWKLFQNGRDISDKIPEDLRTRDMNTYGFYDYWEFDENYNEYWYSYTDGLRFDDWILENRWVKSITDVSEEWVKIYEAFQDWDWRHGQCGGCI